MKIGEIILRPTIEIHRVVPFAGNHRFEFAAAYLRPIPSENFNCIATSV